MPVAPAFQQLLYCPHSATLLRFSFLICEIWRIFLEEVWEIIIQSVEDKWKHQWNQASNAPLTVDLTKKVESFMLPRKKLVTFNRFRTVEGKLSSNSAWWETINDARCDCGVPIQTMQHIVQRMTSNIIKRTRRLPPSSETICKRLDQLS